MYVNLLPDSMNDFRPQGIFIPPLETTTQAEPAWTPSDGRTLEEWVSTHGLSEEEFQRTLELSNDIREFFASLTNTTVHDE
jgi:hypothetical protein